MKILSVFDGMSCGQLALKRSGHKVSKYYASEIDKYAIQVTQNNFPNTIQLGDITKIKAKDLDKIDLFIGGSPCQGFSFAGKQLNFNDERSKLFFEYVRLWNEIKEINPDAKFLLENVNMKTEYLRIISEYLGVFPVRINSNLVSAQNRDRWYWTNIKTKETGLFSELWSDIPQPEDKGILLKDILQPETGVNEKYYISNNVIDRMIRKNYSKPKINPSKTGPLNTKNNSGQSSLDSGTTFIGIDINGKAPTQRSSTGRCLDNKHNYQIVCVAMRGRNPENPSDRRTGSPTEQRLEPKVDGKTNYITSVSKDNLILQINTSKESGGSQPYQQNRVYDVNGIMPALNAELGGRNNVLIQKARGFNKGGVFESKSPSLTSSSWDQNNHLQQNYKLRRLTPIECERLQTVPDNYTSCVSDTQRYKMLGNGWTVDVIAHIFKYLNK